MRASSVDSRKGSGSLRAEEREEDYVADGGRLGEEHDEAVDPQAAAAGGGHAVLEGVDKAVIHRGDRIRSGDVTNGT